MGFAFILLLLLALIVPHWLARGRAVTGATRASAGSATANPSGRQGGASTPPTEGRSEEHARSALSSLTSAVGALTRLAAAKARRGAPARPAAEHLDSSEGRGRLEVDSTPASEPPPPSAYTSLTACFESYLPGAELSPGALDFVCTETEFWAIERRAHLAIAPRPGAGARLYGKLGHYSLAALATMRRGCCPDAEPLLAVVPGLWCGILRDKLRALGAYPEAGPIAAFDETMGCLADRGVRLPDRWDRFTAEQSRAAFREFSRIARRRGSAPAADDRARR